MGVGRTSKRLRRVLVLVLVLAALAACSKFDDASPAPDAGLAADASDERDSGALDGTAPTSYVCGDARHTFCDDFDRPLVDGVLDLSRWSVQGAEAFSLSTDAPRSAPNALRLLSPGITERFYLERSLPVPTRTASCQVAVRLAGNTNPTYGPQFLTLSLGASPPELSYLVFVLPNAFEPYVYRKLPDGGESGDDGYRAFDAGQAASLVVVRVAIAITTTDVRFDTTIAGNTWQQTAALSSPPTRFILRIGANNGSFKPDSGFDLRFDDVACDVD